MIFEKVRVQNYKSIVDSGVIDLKRLTVLAGKNNVGKTAILEAIYDCLQGQFVIHPNDPKHYDSNKGINRNEPVIIDLTLRLTPFEKNVLPELMRLIPDNSAVINITLRVGKPS